MGTAPLAVTPKQTPIVLPGRVSTFTSSAETAGVHTLMTNCAFVNSQVVPLLDARTLTCAG